MTTDLAGGVVPIPVPVDPLSAGLQLVNAIILLITEVVRSQPPDVREALWRMHLEDLKEWRAFLKNLHPNMANPTARPPGAHP